AGRQPEVSEFERSDSAVDIRRSGDRRREYSSLLADTADPSPRASRGSASFAIWDCHRVAASWAPKHMALTPVIDGRMTGVIWNSVNGGVVRSLSNNAIASSS